MRLYPVSKDVIKIKGNFSGINPAGQHFSNDFSVKTLLTEHVADASQIALVVALYPDGRYVVSFVSDGKFTIEVEKGSPVGLLFLEEDRDFVGYLSLGNGIDSLPLNKLAPSVTEIDLKTLTISGNVITPSHNPIGTEIPITGEELIVIAQNDDFFAAILKNPDADGNGKVDFMENEFFDLHVICVIYGGRFEQGNLEPTVNE